jgi:hypothetical protein
VCGDGVVNQARSAALPLGEECDGDDDDACPGKCIAAGELFECTCGNRARSRLFTDAATSEIDTGWTGVGHNQGLADQSGFVTTLENCDCSQMTDGECTGTSTDPVCSVTGKTAPHCSWDTGSLGTCDALGNGNSFHEDEDCFVCDERSENAGAYCKDDGDCGSLCYAGDVAGAPCDAQTDCAAGEVCRGRCDASQTCNVLANGGPLPVSAAGVAVCAVQTFRTDVAGTRNIVTGEHELWYRQYSQIHLGETSERPCPVCGGFCVGGTRKTSVCEGRCLTTQTPCRFDSECPVNDRCGSQSPDCPGGYCNLSLVCGADPAINPVVVGRPCHIDYRSPVFGTLSNDCPPASTNNITGQGLEVDYWPTASEGVTLPATMPCTLPGLELYECPCPDDGGQPTAPNDCTPACNAPGPNFGVGCANGSGSGAATVCNAGANEGRLCDEDEDCPGGACARNPRHCAGDPTLERHECATNADCGAGTCVDACPGGRCLPLCAPVPGDSSDGYCIAGPAVFHCNGPQLSFRDCDEAAATGACSATCQTGGGACDSDDDCAAGDRCMGDCLHAQDCEAGPDGELGNNDDIPGAGVCVEDVLACFLGDVTATGSAAGFTPYDSGAAWCLGSTFSPAINATSGFGGPGRVSVRGTNVASFTSIPPP